MSLNDEEEANKVIVSLVVVCVVLSVTVVALIYYITIKHLNSANRRRMKIRRGITYDTL